MLPLTPLLLRRVPCSWEALPEAFGVSRGRLGTGPGLARGFVGRAPIHDHVSEFAFCFLSDIPSSPSTDTTSSCTAIGLRTPRCLRALGCPFGTETDVECDLLPPLRGVSSSRAVLDLTTCSEALDADRVRFFGRLQTNTDQSAFPLHGDGDLRVIITPLPLLPPARSSISVLKKFSIPIDSG